MVSGVVLGKDDPRIDAVSWRACTFHSSAKVGLRIGDFIAAWLETSIAPREKLMKHCTKGKPLTSAINLSSVIRILHFSPPPPLVPNIPELPAHPYTFTFKQFQLPHSASKMVSLDPVMSCAPT